MLFSHEIVIQGIHTIQSPIVEQLYNSCRLLRIGIIYLVIATDDTLSNNTVVPICVTISFKSRIVK